MSAVAPTQPAAVDLDAETRLRDLAAHANDALAKGRGTFAQTLYHFRAAGEALIEAKALVGHGRWTEWLELNFHGSERNARNYMRLAERWEELEDVANRQGLAVSGLEQAMRLLAKRRAEPQQMGRPLVSGIDYAPLLERPSPMPEGNRVSVNAQDLAEHLAYLHIDGLVPEAILTPSFAATASNADNQLLVRVPELKGIEPLRYGVGVTNFRVLIAALRRCESDVVGIADHGDHLAVHDGLNSVHIRTNVFEGGHAIREDTFTKVAAMLGDEDPRIPLGASIVTFIKRMRRLLNARTVRFTVGGSGDEPLGVVTIGKLDENYATFRFRVRGVAEQRDVEVDGALLEQVLGVVKDWTAWKVCIGQDIIGIETIPREVGPRYLLSGWSGDS